MTSIPDFTEAEHKRVSTLLFDRYGKVVSLQLADSELQLGGNPEYHKITLKIKSRATIQARAAELLFAEYFRASWE